MALDQLQTVDHSAVTEAMLLLKKADTDASPVIIRPKHSRALLGALAELFSIVERNERTALTRRLAFEAAMSLTPTRSTSPADKKEDSQ